MTCPNCGHNSDYPRVCPNCGFVKSNPGNRAAAVAVLILLVLPCGGIGACSLVLGLSSNNSDALFIYAIAAICGLACFGLMTWVRQLWRS
jgi:hypothetical protein